MKQEYMTHDMKKTLMRMLTLMLLMMVSMGARAEIKIDLGGKDNKGVYEGGTVTAKQSEAKDGKVTVTLTFTPYKNYSITRKDVLLAYTAPTNTSGNTRADNPTLGETFNPSGSDDVFAYPNFATYTVTVDANLGLSVQNVEFKNSRDSGAKGGGDDDPKPKGYDYSGTYYIANYNNGGAGGYQANDKTKNYYLCPSTNFYDTDMPLLTTYKERQESDKKPENSRWRVVFAKTIGEVDYYQLIHNSSNQYLTWNEVLSIANPKNNDRVRVHLQLDLLDIETSDDQLFFFVNGNVTNSYNICPKAWADRTNGASLNPAKYNNDLYEGENTNKGKGAPGNIQNKQGQTIGSGGLIGVYNTNDGTGLWYFEDVQCKTPVISYSSETGKVTITSATEGASIYYTTNGENPTSSSYLYNNTPFDLTSITTIKAIAVKDWMDDSDVATVTHVPNPTITLTIPDGGYTYDKTEKEPEVSLKNGETPISSSEYEVSYTDNINAGTATVTISDAEGGDYIVYGSTTFTIAPKALNVTADAKTKGYGDSDPEFTYTATELVEGDVLEGTLSRAEGENVGNYAISQGTLANSNYSITFTPLLVLI